MTEQPPLSFQCMHCGEWFRSLDEVRRHQTLVDIANNEPQILDWNLEPNYIDGEWENG